MRPHDWNDWVGFDLTGISDSVQLNA
ncbi:uncharacterized protein RAG0_09280 [Rhynchosporium agropyri]|uniref:Uncharacterized protein n=1 Tax=Rhynchosporium agropyri TaxID=914238 RepID=A0A1E1KUS3_9HELO|nr:uncharacterized protein RAG0_09280 [Rhynchosporium agropyri]